MRKHLPIAGALAFSLIALPAAASAQTTTDTSAEPFDQALVQEKLDEFHEITGYSVLTEVRSEGEDWSGALGPRSIEAPGAYVETDDRVRIASLTKTMVSSVLLQLQTEGEVDLDRTVSDYLPGLLPYQDEPSIRQVMNHTGGLHDYFTYLYASLLEGDMSDVYDHYQDYYGAEELIELSTVDPLLFEPGTDWSYSNTGYMALGLLIEELTGNGLAVELEDRVFEPAGMDDSYFPKPQSSGIRGPNPVPYVTTGEAADPLFDTTRLSNSQMWAAGGVISTMEDVNDFYGAYVDGEILNEAEFAEATEFFETEAGFDYGLGLLQMGGCTADDPWIGHTGGGLGHQTYSLHSVDGQHQITVTWNVDDQLGHDDPAALADALEGLLAAALCGIDLDAAQPDSRTFDAPATELPFLP
ncbi:serine hydrolase domain-containing protein [Glycomyces buryatensis]|uniref:Beta-lactamase family protein n=1 Tax=Glycomyces buryatensis TaxID=2570927 RepID=A0A4S8QGK6_9ACTN|nr:serine hydrolase domain-containing protein [Glycomyces buryatensis]THV42312.1 beta-lactamase family protein [Glycomyces buryatensis]